MSIYKPHNGNIYWYDFWYKKERFHKSCGTGNRKEAERIEREVKAGARSDYEQGKRSEIAPMTLDEAALRYWEEVGQNHVCNKDTFRDLARLIDFIGKDKPFQQITDADVARLVAWRRGHTIAGKAKDSDGKPMRLISSATVNRTTTVLLKGMFGHARRAWKLPLPQEPNWRVHMLKEPRERVRQLHEHEADALDAAMRDDYAPWVQFAHLTGWRQTETLLRWNNVIWNLKPVRRNGVMVHGQITTIGKRGMPVTVLITDSIHAILQPLKGHHPEFVFTYVAKTTRKGRVRGKRYPITKEDGKSQWRRVVNKAGVTDFRFHDLRHDAATKAIQAGASMKMVQKMLGHTSITTTARYAHVMDDDVAAMTERVAKSRKKSRKAVVNAA